MGLKRVRGDSECTSCPLYENAQSVCLMGLGPIPAEVMIVGEAPGWREDDINRPFQGPAGEFPEAREVTLRQFNPRAPFFHKHIVRTKLVLGLNHPYRCREEKLPPGLVSHRVTNLHVVL